MAGVAILVGPSIALDGDLDPAGIVALLISPICWAGGSVFAAHRASLPRDPFVTTGLQMFSGAIVLGAAAVADRRARPLLDRRGHPRVAGPPSST